MEEDIKNMSKEELLEYLEEISQQLDNIALDQIKIAIAELQYFKDQYKELEYKYDKALSDLVQAENKNKKLEEENKTLKNFTSYIFNEDVAEFIPTSLVKEKIEELKGTEELLSDEQGYWGGSDLLAKIEVLQDLLERSREDDNNKNIK